MNNRIIHVDLLKILATFSVVFLHVAASNWPNATLGTYDWNVLNFYNSLVRFGVPIFVMISGMFLLEPDKEVSIKDIYGKYILRIIIALVSWSLLYAVYDIFINGYYEKLFWKNFIFGRYHLWYLYMLIGLYMITPFFQIISRDRKLMEYFLILSLIFTFVFPIIIKVFNLTDVDVFIKKIQIHFPLGYAGYYIGGYYFHTYDLKKKIKYIIYALGATGLAATYIFTDILSLKTGLADSTFYSNFSPNVMIVSLAVFVFFKYELSKIQFKEKLINLINKVSACTFRIYLMHDFFIILLSNIGFSTLNYNPVVSVPFAAIIIFISSLIVSHLISKVPLLNRIL